MDAQTTAEAFTWTEYLGVLIYFPLCTLGLMIHFLKKKIKTENFHEVKHYFTTHRVSTLTSVLSAVVLLYIFDAMGQLNVVSAILSGYATDSLFQRQVAAMTMGDPSGPNRPPGHNGIYQPYKGNLDINNPPGGNYDFSLDDVSNPAHDDPEEGA